MDYGTFLNSLIAIGYVAFFTFGAVYATTIFVKTLTSAQKFALAVVYALIFGFIPANLGSEIMNRIVDAIKVAIGTSTISGIANKIGGK